MEPAMAYTLLFNENPPVWHLRFTGTFTEAAYSEARDVVEHFLAERGPSPVIIDFSSISEFDISVPILEKIARLPSISAQCRVAVAPRPVVFGSVRMVQMIRECATGEDTEFEVVEELEDAYAMLGISTPEFRCVSRSDGSSATARGE
jgi:hypothetical protein